MTAPSPTLTSARSAARPFRVIGLASMAAAGALVLSACGGDVPAGEAWNEARTQLQDAESFRITSTMSEQGDDGGDKDKDKDAETGQQPTSGTFDLSGFTTEPNAEMTMEMTGGEMDMTMAVREVGEKGYIRMDVAGEEMDEQTKSMLGLGDKWIEQDIPEDERGMMKSVRDDLMDGLPAEGALDDADAERQEVDRDGQKAYRYEVPEDVAKSADEKSDDQKKDSGDDGAAGSALNEVDMSDLQAFLVDEDGRLVALELKDSDSDETTELVFSDWGSVEKVEAPAEDEISSGPEAPAEG